MNKKIKHISITLFVSLIIIFLIHLTLFNNAYTYSSISNALFVVGLFMFFISLIGITDADKVFRIVVYSFKSVGRKKNRKYRSYYDYTKETEGEKLIPYAFEMMVISGIYILIAFYLSQRYFDSL